MARCITPITTKNKKTGRFNDVPCSRCWPCLQRKADGWAIRILHEKKRSTSAYFITLTYDDKHVPINEKTMQLTLQKQHLIDYMKRLRRLHDHAYKVSEKAKAESKPIKYYAVGEYGEDYNRPHYHIILFNAIKELIPLPWTKDKELLGMVQIGEKGVTAGGARYLTQYMMTGQTHDELRQKPFQLMSKHIGENYITEIMKKWHLQHTGKPVINKHGNLIPTRDRYYIINDGYKVAMPRYYRDKIFPKIYRDTDAPILQAKFQKAIDKKNEKKSFIEQALNHAGQIETNKCTYQKKIKAKAFKYNTGLTCVNPHQ